MHVFGAGETGTQTVSASGQVPKRWVCAVVAALLVGCGSETKSAIQPVDETSAADANSSAVTTPAPTSTKSATTSTKSATTASRRSTKATTAKPSKTPTTRGEVVTTVTIDPTAPGAKKPTNGAPLVSITTTTRPDGKSPTYEVDQLPNADLVFSNKPMKAPSATRTKDGTVTSAGGYIARTIQTANGMLFEPKWTEAEQPTVDLIHTYIDEWFLAEADNDLTPGPPPAMTKLEDPHPEILSVEDEFSKDPYDSHRRLQSHQEDGEVSRVPINSKSYVFVTGRQYGNDFNTGETKVIYWRVCEANDLVAIDQSTGRLDNAVFTGRYMEIATGPNKHPGGIWMLDQTRSQPNMGAC